MILQPSKSIEPKSKYYVLIYSASGLAITVYFGKYPPGGHTVLRSGDKGSDVIWLKEQLQIALGLTTALIGSNIYDQELKSLVERFQLRQGLRADGVTGSETFIYLNTATKRPGVPLLQATGNENEPSAHLSGSQ